VDWAKVKGMNKAADVCRCDPDAYTLVDCARTNDVGGVGALLLQDVGRNKRDYGEPAIVAAAKAASIGVIEVLAGLGAVPDVEGNALDLEATDDNGESALTAACRLGHEDVVLLLLRLRAKRNPEAIAIAAQKGHVLCAVVTNTDPAVTSLHDACALGKLLQVESLLLQGVEVNELDQRAGRNACTPLMAAAASAGGGRRGKAVMIVVERLLREDGVKVNAKNSQGVTALMIAAGNGAIDLCKILIKHGADKDDKDCKGRGVVWWA
jgi:ankyrin repeat protein